MKKKNLECWRATYLTYYCYCLRKLLLKKRSTRRFWTRKWSKRRYFGRGLSSLFFEELAVKDKKSFKNFTKMSIRTFDDLLAKVGPKICRQNITFKECISPRIRLFLTLDILSHEKPFRAYIMASEFQYHLPYIQV
jgi:hypothetical protein